MYELHLVSDKKLWDDFVFSSPQNNLSSQTKFLDAIQKEYEMLVVSKGESILLGVVFVKNNAGHPILEPLMYQGVLFSSSLAALASHTRVKKSLDGMEFLLAECVKRFQQISFSLHHSFKDLRSFQWFHYNEPEKGQFKLELNYTAILSFNGIGDFEELIENARTVRRQEYRRCVNDGFTTEESEDILILDQLHEKTFERQGMKRSKSDKFLTTTFAKEAISSGFGRLLICRDKFGVPASASLFLFDDKTAYYLVGANNPEFRKYGTGSYLVFEQLRSCLEQGLTQVDFVGVNSPNRGDYKTSFNAVPIPYFTVKLDTHKINN